MVKGLIPGGVIFLWVSYLFIKKDIFFLRSTRAMYTFVNKWHTKIYESATVLYQLRIL
jgi:hypothetical protein